MALATIAEVPHGTSGGYSNHGCRCAACKTAHAKKMATYRANRPHLSRVPESKRYGKLKRSGMIAVRWSPVGSRRDKTRAQRVVYNAILSGQLVRPTRCSKCLLAKRLCAHHDDYTKPLAVRWLCYVCHRGVHVGWKLPDAD